MANADSVSVLELTLHGARVGYLAGYKGGRTILTFTPEFKSNTARPTSSLQEAISHIRKAWINSLLPHARGKALRYLREAV